jgi:uncharacterized protein (TIGR03032 family)
MGLWGDDQTLYLSTLFQLWRFENSLDPGETYQGYDRLYVPQLGWTTGDLDIHDIAVDAQGCPVFVNTLFSCLATVSERHSFIPLWQPPFITKLAAEDRCHLNGGARSGRATLRDGAEVQARAERRSLWRDPSPVPPRDFRRPRKRKPR